MGCDIHGCVERRVNNNWLMFDRIHGTATARNYARFNALAGVRGDGPKPIGVPFDASESTLLAVQGWGQDGHSHSWLPLKDAVKIFQETDGLCKSWMDEEYYFGADFEGHPEIEWRLVFWFDN